MTPPARSSRPPTERKRTWTNPLLTDVSFERPPNGGAAPVDQPAVTLRPLGGASARRAEHPLARWRRTHGRGDEQGRQDERADARAHPSGPRAVSTAASTLPSSTKARAASRSALR